MLALAPAEEHDELHLRALPEHLGGPVALALVVVPPDLRPEPHLLERHVDLVAPARARLSLLLVAPFAVVHDPADGRVRGRGDLDEIEVACVRVLARVVGASHSELLSFASDQAHLTRADLVVDLRRHPGGAVDLPCWCSPQRMRPFSKCQRGAEAPAFGSRTSDAR